MKQRRSPIAVAVAAAGAAAIGLAAGAAPDAASPQKASPPAVTCDTRIQVVPRRGNLLSPAVRKHAIRIGDLYFLGARPLARAPRAEFEPRHGEPAPVKTPFVVPSGDTSVTVALAEPSRDGAAIDVGLDQRPYDVRADAITLEPCAPDAEVAGRRVGPYTPFNAGFALKGAQCLRLTVLTEDRSDTAEGRIALGRRTCR
jgi:hypothetical protein